MLIYDIEIINGIPPRDGPREKGITYCNGWEDYANMGISVICCYDSITDRYRVFIGDENGLRKFIRLCHVRNVLVSFNGMNFDNNVINAEAMRFDIGVENIIDPAKCYDILRMVWAANGLDGNFKPRTHGGYSLDAIAKANGLPGKTGNGELAPVMWQRGQYADVIDYCLEDVRITRVLLNKILKYGGLMSPKTNQFMQISPLSDSIRLNATVKQGELFT